MTVPHADAGGAAGAAPIHFFFDFSSPYSHIAAHLIDDIAARYGRTVLWRPILLGVIMKETGAGPLLHIPLKGAYAKHDLPRLARRHGVPLRMPDTFPILGQNPSRVMLWLRAEHPEHAVPFARAALTAFWRDALDIAATETLLPILEAVAPDLADTDLAALCQDHRWKQALVDETRAAREGGVCGAPFFVVDGEPFWGADRLPMIAEWLKTGGW